MAPALPPGTSEIRRSGRLWGIFAPAGGRSFSFPTDLILPGLPVQFSGSLYEKDA
jgi:hypothetical protein